jgi:hypothetical protein
MKPLMLAIATSVALGATPIIAAGQHGPKAQPTTAKSAHAQAPQTKPSTTKPAAAKPATVKPATVKPAMAVKPAKATAPATKAPKTTQTTKAAKPATTTPKLKPAPTKSEVTATPVKSTKPATDTKKAVATKSAKAEPRSTTSTTPAAPTTTVTLTPVQQKLVKNTNLASKLQTRLPPGTNLLTAADGFRNLGQFVAAVNVSNNLGIPFADLKTRLVTENFSLGQSIQSLKPVSSPTVEAQRAEYDARGMIADSERQPIAQAPAKLKAKSKPSSTASQR